MRYVIREKFFRLVGFASGQSGEDRGGFVGAAEREESEGAIALSGEVRRIEGEGAVELRERVGGPTVAGL